MNYVKMLEYCTNEEQKIELLRRSDLTVVFHINKVTGKRDCFFYWCPESKHMIMVSPRSVVKVKLYTSRFIEQHFGEYSLMRVYYKKLMEQHEVRTNARSRQRPTLSLRKRTDSPSQA